MWRPTFRPPALVPWLRRRGRTSQRPPVAEAVRTTQGNRLKREPSHRQIRLGINGKPVDGLLPDRRSQLECCTQSPQHTTSTTRSRTAGFAAQFEWLREQQFKAVTVHRNWKSVGLFPCATLMRAIHPSIQTGRRGTSDSRIAEETIPFSRPHPISARSHNPLSLELKYPSHPDDPHQGSEPEFLLHCSRPHRADRTTSWRGHGPQLRDHTCDQECRNHRKSRINTACLSLQRAHQRRAHRPT